MYTYIATKTSPKTIIAHATFWLIPGNSPTTRPENNTTQTNVNPENGASIDGLAYFIANTQHNGFRKDIPIIPEM